MSSTKSLSDLQDELSISSYEGDVEAMRSTIGEASLHKEHDQDVFGSCLGRFDKKNDLILGANNKPPTPFERASAQHGDDFVQSIGPSSTLTEAVRSGNPEAVDVLIEHGADPRAGNSPGEMSPLDVAKNNGDTDGALHVLAKFEEKEINDILAGKKP
jgi:hypothetical protein